MNAAEKNHLPGQEYPQAMPGNFSRTSVEHTAEEVARAAGYAPGDDIIPVANAFGGTVHFVDYVLWEQTAHASIVVHEQCNFDIYVSNFTGPTRNRFSIAHELGHYFLHSMQGEMKIRAERFGSTREEWEANWFAAAFLMPAQPFSDYYQKYGPRQTAVKFYVSPAAVSVRADTLGIK